MAIMTTNSYKFNVPPISYDNWRKWDDEWDKDVKRYVEDDVKKVTEASIRTPKVKINIGIKKVIFNPPATIVFWEDGAKTVVKCADGEVFNESAGVALCFMKRICVDYKSKLKRL